MKFIKSVLKNILPKDLPKPLGRWNVEQCNIKTNYKIDLSNEDHCGPCGQYALTKMKVTNNTTLNDNVEIQIKKNNVTSSTF
jgi:hypothetical protein